MFNLIVAIISIGIFAALLGAGQSYFDGDNILSIKEKSKIDAAITKMSTSITAYNLGRGDYPRSLSDIIPEYTRTPVLPTGLEWQSLSFNSGNGDISVCFGGTVKESVFRALKESKKDAGGDVFIIGSKCGDKADAAFDASDVSSVVVTYTIR